KPYNDAERHLLSVIARLPALLSQSSSQQERMARIEYLCRQNLEFITLLSRRSTGYGTASAQFQETLMQAKSITDELRREFWDMQHEEDRVLAEQNTRLSQINRVYFNAVSGGVICGLLGGFVAMLLFTSAIVQRVEHLEANAYRLAQGHALTQEF